jgi:citrate lyase subunit beta / citryl-CoA lyase
MNSDQPASRPRRSVLYLPGANERALEKARTLPADALILDLEDAVAPEAKAVARERVCTAAASGDYGERELAIRVNGLDTAWFADDVRAAAQAGPNAVVVPKIASAQDVHVVEQALEASGAPEPTKIWAMIESPAAILHAERIAAASPRLSVLVLGTNDLAAELHAEHVPGRAPLLAALGQAMLAARAHGRVILDGVYNAVGDPAGFEAECLQGRQFGFDGKTLIHPDQVAICNRVFSPSPEQLADAAAVLAAWEQAQAGGRAVATVNGRLIEALHVVTARRLLALAAAPDRTGGED